MQAYCICCHIGHIILLCPVSSDPREAVAWGKLDKNSCCHSHPILLLHLLWLHGEQPVGTYVLLHIYPAITAP